MKLAACITVFDGTELLEKAILNLVPHVDFIIICYQTVSNNGNTAPGLEKELDRYTHHSEIFLVKYVPSMEVNAKENERRKHTLMISKAREYGATHFMMAATDHFYNAKEFVFGKAIVDALDYDSTFTKMYTYYKKPEWQLTPIETYYMPFICKLYPETKIERVRGFPLLVDPSCQMNTLGKWYAFKEFEIMLHHYSMCRVDIRGKFINAASPWKWEQIERFTKDWEEYDINTNPGVYYFHGRKIKVVPDYFELSTIFNPS